MSIASIPYRFTGITDENMLFVYEPETLDFGWVPLNNGHSASEYDWSTLSKNSGRFTKVLSYENFRDLDYIIMKVEGVDIRICTFDKTYIRINTELIDFGSEVQKFDVSYVFRHSKQFVARMVVTFADEMHWLSFVFDKEGNVLGYWTEDYIIASSYSFAVGIDNAYEEYELLAVDESEGEDYAYRG